MAPTQEVLHDYSIRVELILAGESVKWTSPLLKASQELLPLLLLIS